MDITFITNPIAGGWSPRDLDNFLGGDEEALCLLSQALSRAGHKVEVYTSLPQGVRGIEDGTVKYKPFETFDADASFDTLITWKDRTSWMRSVKANRRVHFLAGIEPRWSVGCLSGVDKIVAVGKYELTRMPWLPPEKTAIIPYGLDTKLYTPPEKPKEDLAIYATSPNRGLDTLLLDWGRIRAVHPGLDLFVSYGWVNVDKMGGVAGQQFKTQIMPMLQQPGIASGLLSKIQMAQLFQAAKYIIHPLNNPDADLLGFSMLKAQTCGVIPVIPQASGCGFQESVRSFIPYRDFIAGSVEQLSNPLAWTEPVSWDRIVSQYWEPLLASIPDRTPPAIVAEMPQSMEVAA